MGESSFGRSPKGNAFKIKQPKLGYGKKGGEVKLSLFFFFKCGNTK